MLISNIWLIGWRTIFWISYAAWALFEFWVFSRDRHAVRGRKRDGGSIFVLVALIVLAIFTAFLSPWLAPWARIAIRSPVVPALAALMLWSGMALRLWAILTLGRFFRTTVTVQDDHRLVTAGPYRVLRHPAYTGAIVTICGIALFMNNWLSFLGALVLVLIGYGIRIRVEERALRERFGDAFREQRARSWAILPFVW
jgi:protein-S-isoprenylcysteine O-methyltransferase